MNKLIIFDLDGVLLDSRSIHYDSLNAALAWFNKDWCISWEEHLAKYDGLSTTKKLELLEREKGVPKSHHQKIWEMKQLHTVDKYVAIRENPKITQFMRDIRAKGIKIAVASNSIRGTLIEALVSLNIMNKVDYVASNEDVKYPKPYPEIYWQCMKALHALPQDTVIIEDSHIGRLGALSSGAHLIPVKDNEDFLKGHAVTDAIDYLARGITKKVVPWRDPKMNVLIPMAGAGSRFEKAGFTFPKPLIEVNGKPMIQVVCDNLNIDGHYIFIVQKSHYEKYNLQYLLNLIKPGCDIVQVDGVTQGAACTTLLAEQYINNNQPLVIANSDQFVEWNSNEVLYAFSADTIDAGIVTFKATHPKWSFARLDEHGFVAEVAEKKPISDNATVGIYYWKRGSDYVRYAKQMIENDIRTNGEFYVCPVFNEAIQDGKRVRVKEIQKMWGLGTPEDLAIYLEHHK